MSRTNKISCFALLWLFSACAGSQASRVDAKTRYVEALKAKSEGDAERWSTQMLRLAADEQPSRASRRALASLTGGDLWLWAGVLGIGAGIAVPNFLKYQARALQAEAKETLLRYWAAQSTFHAKKKRYTSDLDALDFELNLGARYIYLIDETKVLSSGPVDDRLMLLVGERLAQLGIAAGASRNAFLAIAIANLDKDDDLDIWSIDESGQVRHVGDDLE